MPWLHVLKGPVQRPKLSVYSTEVPVMLSTWKPSKPVAVVNAIESAPLIVFGRTPPARGPICACSLPVCVL